MDIKEARKIEKFFNDLSEKEGHYLGGHYRSKAEGFIEAYEKQGEIIESLEGDLAVAKATIKKLAGALMPFADFAKNLPMAGKPEPSSIVYAYDQSQFTVSDLMKANEALSLVPKELREPGEEEA